MELLTDRQTALLRYLRQYLLAHGVPPTIAEMSAEFGYASQQAVSKLLDKLEAKGAIERTPGAWRSIRILWPDSENDPGVLRPAYRLPLLGRIAGGTPITVASDASGLAVDHLDVDPALFSTRPDALFTLQGNSVINLGILDGDTIGVSYRSEFSNRQIVAAVVVDEKTGEPEYTLKRYEKRGHIITLHAENDDLETYKPLVYDTRKTQAYAFGIYCGLIRRKVQ